MSIRVDAVAKPEAMNHDSSILDLAFAMDCTGSMGTYISMAQQSINHIVDEIVSKESSDIRLALVEYRDHPPEDRTFVTRVNDFTPYVSTMKSCLNAARADGGGDTPEAVADALYDVLNLNWRSSATKICVFIADAPPHGLSRGGDRFPDGCPSGLDPMKTARQLAERDITVYMVGCEPSITPYKHFFMAVAHMTGGQYVPLTDASSLAKVIIGGAREELSLQRLRLKVDEEIRKEVETKGVVDEDSVSKRVMNKFRDEGYKTKHITINKLQLKTSTSEAVKYSECSSMADVKKDFVEAGTTERSTSSSGDVVDVEEDDITLEQAKRLVKRSVATRMILKK
ncbi:uncharacterized protein LOC100372473 [Saccoglossus kowalevskii]|uniref:Uncharacterized protein LOC100372473 n=1 Tax=Saccoglossus kowalevskii TaxID=10224 RepID=A0ABM0GRW9_SACKO|nr:PREDICTED: uncharacterized protein LOC100372473 [Saccoglossus kowalevskii]